MKLYKKISLMLAFTLSTSILPVQYAHAGIFSCIFNIFKRKPKITPKRLSTKSVGLVLSGCLACVGLVLCWLNKDSLKLLYITNKITRSRNKKK